MKWPFVVALSLGACGTSAYDAQLAIREGGDHSLFGSVSNLSLRAERDGSALGTKSYAPTSTRVSVSDVAFGPSTIFSLEGLASSGDVIASGNTCPFDFEKDGAGASLYFAPTQYFALAAGMPSAARTGQMAVTVANGDVLLFGGTQSAAAVADTIRFSQSTSTFADDSSMALSLPRSGGEVSNLAIGALLSGGVDATGAPLGSAELFVSETMQLSPVFNQELGARSTHRATVLDPNRVILTGGVDASGQSLDTTAVVIVQSDGTVQVTAGPPLVRARAAHAALVAIDTPVVIGGYGTGGTPITSIEALQLADDGDIGSFSEIAQLMYARANATATVLDDGSILVTGGIGTDGSPRGDAEVYNPITQDTRLYSMAFPRSGHTATLLSDGHVLVVGGSGAAAQEAELFIVDVGFVSEHPLQQPHVGHLAVPLCDGTVLVEGGAPGAELYVPAVD